MFLNDVIEFHEKFNIRRGDSKEVTKKLTDKEIRFRVGFLLEELTETMEAFGLQKGENNKKELMEFIARVEIEDHNYDELEVIDGLLDLIYVALGTLDLMHLSEDHIRDHWAEIQRANMTKERAKGDDDPKSKRKNSLDIVKPDGWKGPDHKGVMEKHVQQSFGIEDE